MNFFKRALYSVTQRKGKSVILFIIIFVLGNVIAGAVAIKESTNNVEKTIKSQLAGSASITLDYEKVEKILNENPEAKIDFLTPTTKEIEEIGKLSYVKYYDNKSILYIPTNNLKATTEAETDDGSSIGTANNSIEIMGTTYAPLSDIQEKKIELKDGRIFEQTDIDSNKKVAIISKKLAEENNLHVGDQMVIDAAEIDYSNGTHTGTSLVDYSVEIIGTFSPINVERKDQSSDDKMNQAFMDLTAQNTVYMPYGTMLDFANAYIEYYNETVTKDEEKLTIERYLTPTPTFVLKSPDDSEAFKTEATTLLSSDDFVIRLSTDDYDSIAGSIANMSKLSGLVLIISVVASLLIISLVTVLFLRDRRHEMGIYLALGERRYNVIFQIVIEVLLVAVVALTISLITGNLVAKSLSDSLLSNDMFSQSSGGYYGTTITTLSTSDVTNAYQISFSPMYVVSFYLVGLGTILLSTVIPLIYILRLNPKKIMM